MPHLAQTVPVAELSKRYANMNAGRCRSRVAFKVSLVHLRAQKERMRQATGVALSSQDVLTAYILSALNRHSSTPITCVTNAASYRNVPGVLESPDIAGNAIYIIPTTLDSTCADVANIACAIRRSIEACRNPTFVQEYMSVASTLMLSATNSGRSMFFAVSPDKVSVNSNAAWVYCDDCSFSSVDHCTASAGLTGDQLTSGTQTRRASSLLA
ncbi:hypothetical protein BD413DRAFT_464252 [Trametes elegans]|nr:hypothetical protein BD413DRAFT_464252 [Trametes elegans]